MMMTWWLRQWSKSSYREYPWNFYVLWSQGSQHDNMTGTINRHFIICTYLIHEIYEYFYTFIMSLNLKSYVNASVSQELCYILWSTQNVRVARTQRTFHTKRKGCSNSANLPCSVPSRQLHQEGFDIIWVTYTGFAPCCWSVFCAWFRRSNSGEVGRAHVG